MASIGTAIGFEVYPFQDYILIEGIDGTGKSTLAQALASFCDTYYHKDAVLLTKEPTETGYGLEARRILSSPELMASTPPAELVRLIELDRHEHMTNVVRPALFNQGFTVIQDRGYYSTAAYQGALGQDIFGILKRNRFTADTEPGTVLILDLPVEEALKRITARGVAAPGETYENLSKVRDLFLSFRHDPRVFILDASQPVDRLLRRAVQLIWSFGKHEDWQWRKELAALPMDDAGHEEAEKLVKVIAARNKKRR